VRIADRRGLLHTPETFERFLPTVPTIAS
jgi:hypothetical protein